jgi:hypothetical protein
MDVKPAKTNSAVPALKEVGNSRSKHIIRNQRQAKNGHCGEYWYWLLPAAGFGCGILEGLEWPFLRCR